MLQESMGISELLRELLLPWLHPDFEIVPSRDFPDQRVLRGIAGLEEWDSSGVT